MDIASWTKLLEILVPIFQELIWATLILIIFMLLRIPLKRLLQDPSVSNITVKAGATGFEATFQKEQQIMTAALLGASSATSEKGLGLTDDQIKSLIYVVDETSALEIAQQLENTSVLWIDEDPTRSSYLRRALEALGIKITAVSTPEARAKKYDVIVYVVRRPYQNNYLKDILPWLADIAQQSDKASIITYVPIDLSNSPDLETELTDYGMKIEKTPLGLFNTVIRTIQRKRAIVATRRLQQQINPTRRTR